MVSDDDETPPTDAQSSDHPLLDGPVSIDDTDTGIDRRPVPVDDPDDLPPPREPPEPRTYFEIRPADSQVSLASAVQAMEQLYTALERATDTRLRDRLTGSTSCPTVEWLIVSDGAADPTIRWLVGTDDADFQESLEGVLRTGLPRTYEVRTVEFHPRFVEDYLATPTDPDDLDPYVAGVEYEGRASLPQDWLTPLDPFDTVEGSTQSTGRRRRRSRRTRSASRDDDQPVPLAGLLETIANADVPVIYQVGCQYCGSASDAASSYVGDLEDGAPTFLRRLLTEVYSPDPEDGHESEPHPSDQARINDIKARDCSRTFVVSARAVALTRQAPRRADGVADRLASGLGTLDGPKHEIRGRVHTDESGLLTSSDAGTQVYDALCDRQVHAPGYGAVTNRLPLRSHTSSGIVATPAELPGFWLIDGTGLTVQGERALATRASERTGMPMPSPNVLLRYGPPGMALGMPLTHDRQPADQPIYLPPSLQPTHQLIVGGTGSGKTVAMQTAALTNHAATDGPDIHFYHKAGAAEDYLRAHYATYGDLDNVQYFDLTQVLPALSFFDIRDLLDAGYPREEARSRKAGHYAEILKGLMGSEAYENAADSIKLISNTIQALFDPVHGQDAFSHEDLYNALSAILRGEEPPATAIDEENQYFDNLFERDRDVFTSIAGGALGRVETVGTDGRLGPIFRHTHDRSAASAPPPESDGDDPRTSADGGAARSPTDGHSTGAADETPATGQPTSGPADETPVGGDTGTPQFSFADLVDEDQVIVFDFGGMDNEGKRALTLVLFSDLWSALQARETADAVDDPPLVNCYVDEAGGVADSSLVDTFLSQGRSFGLAMCLGVQYPEQLASSDPEDDTYLEALNEIGTVIAGQVRVDDHLASVFTTGEHSRSDVKARLSNMASGEWFVRLAAGFGESPPRPFLMKSLPALPGHPASDQPLDGAAEAAYESARADMIAATRTEAGIPVEEVTSVDSADQPTAESNPAVDAADGDGETDGSDRQFPWRTDSLLPYSTRLPDCLTYDSERHALQCDTCTTRYDPDIEGLQAAVECCHSLADVDRDDIPVCSPSLKRSPEEVADSEWSVRELLFLQAVWDAQQRRTHLLEYDLRRDSMILLREYAGLDSAAVTNLIDAGLLRKDRAYPSHIYSVTAAGRDVIGEHNREGIDHGAGKGDLGESSLHVLLVILAADLARVAYRDDPESTVEQVETYYELEDGHRLDVVGLDADGEIVLTIEAERVNNDVAEAAVTDFDKMAACDPEESLWVVASQADAARIMEALHDPADGEPRIDRTYSKTTPSSDYKLDAPGMTDVFTVNDVESILEDG